MLTLLIIINKYINKADNREGKRMQENIKFRYIFTLFTLRTYLYNLERGTLENDDTDRYPSEICCDNKKPIYIYRYNETNCTIIFGGQLTDWFHVNMDVIQGCIMSPSLFNIFLDHVMKGLACFDRNIRLDDEMSIDIRYADDTTLVSAVFEKLQIATSELENACHKWSLKISPLKCAVLTTEKKDIKIGNNIDPKVN